MKRIISCLIIMIIVLMNIAVAASGDNSQRERELYEIGYQDGYSDGKNYASTPKEPNIIFENQNGMTEVKAGGKFNLIIDYKNDSTATARSIKITPDYENTPLVYERPNIYQAEKNLKANATGIATFSFQVKENAKNAVYPIHFKVECKNNREENFSNMQTVYIKVTDEKMNSFVTISNIQTEPEQLSAGEKFLLQFDINNIGEMPMNETKLKLTDLSSDTFMPVDGTDFLYIGKIGAKTKITKSFQMIASQKITSGNHSIGANIQYKDEDGAEVSVEKTIYLLNILNPSEKKEEEKKDDNDVKSMPKIIISSYATTPEHIIAGDTFTFQFHFKNTSRDTSVQNMKITIQSENGSFMIANGSNTFYIEKLAPQGILSKSIELNVKQDLASKSYPLSIAFDYEDDKCTGYQSSEIINIPVTEYSKLVINSAYAGEGFVDEPTSLAFDYINMGKAVISNLTASVEGDYESVQPINYIGNIEAGNSDYYDIQVKPTKEGENYGILILSFEDSSGKKLEVKKDFVGIGMSETIMNDFPGDYPGDSIMPEEEIPIYSIWQYIGWGVGSFLIGFVLAKMITTKIIRKKLEDEI